MSVWNLRLPQKSDEQPTGAASWEQEEAHGVFLLPWLEWKKGGGCWVCLYLCGFPERQSREDTHTHIQDTYIHRHTRTSRTPPTHPTWWTITGTSSQGDKGPKTHDTPMPTSIENAATPWQSWQCTEKTMISLSIKWEFSETGLWNQPQQYQQRKWSSGLHAILFPF